MSSEEMKFTRVERNIGGVRVALETGRIARQAHGAVICTVGDSMSFAAVVTSKGREDLDFFPLTVDYREKTEAAGKIPGGFFKREGRPNTKEILTMRMTDRAVRPMFPDGFRQEVQILTHALSYDGVRNNDIAAMIGGFAATRISGLPVEETLGAVRVGHLDGKLVAFPEDSRLRGESRLNLVLAGHKNGLNMVEALALELTEEEIIDALEFGHAMIRDIVSLIDELAEKTAKPRMEFAPPDVDQSIVRDVERYRSDVEQRIHTPGKHERQVALDSVREKAIADLTQGIEDAAELVARTKAIKNAFGDLKTNVERESILQKGRRADGRGLDEIRPIWILPNFIPRQHGSVVFTRGETQAMVNVTLGTPDDEQIIDGLEDNYRKSFYLHYNFPPYSVGETRRMLGPGRREIGHGMLAERALAAVLPSKERFPYTIRIVSDITESNGSSSMASVCGGCLAMMLAGVPISQPVAGIAMGLVTDGDRVAILSDITGGEDHHGDMDFKVAGSGLGITALQMDIKVKSVSRELLARALEQAREGRKHILRKMLEAVPRPNESISEFAPRFETVKIPSEKIGFLIGPAGKNIRGMQEEYSVRISVDDTGLVKVFGTDSAKVTACVNHIRSMCETPKIGTKYRGTVKSVRDFGAFVEILPGVEGLLHVSEISSDYIESVTDVINVGDEVDVTITNVDDRGKVRLSMKEPSDAVGAMAGEGEERDQGRGPRERGGDRGGDRGGRGGGRGGDRGGRPRR